MEKKNKGNQNASKWKPEYVEQAKSMMAIGLAERDLAILFEVEPLEITRWKKKHPGFDSAIKKGRSTGKMSMTKSLFEMAQKGNVAAAIFWLCNRCKDDWQQTQRIEARIENIPGVDLVPIDSFLKNKNGG